MAFSPGSHINRDAGKLLASWARGETVETPHKELWDRARRIAHEGVDEIKTFFEKVASDDDRHNLAPLRRELWEAAKEADRNRTGIG